MPVEWPRFLHIAEPQPVNFWRDAFQALQAMRPHEGVKSGDDCARDNGQRQALAPVAGRKQREAIHQRAAEQRIGQPHGREGIANRRPIVV